MPTGPAILFREVANSSTFFPITIRAASRPKPVKSRSRALKAAPVIRLSFHPHIDADMVAAQRIFSQSDVVRVHSPVQGSFVRSDDHFLYKRP
jgi:hypothetical protein